MTFGDEASRAACERAACIYTELRAGGRSIEATLTEMQARGHGTIARIHAVLLVEKMRLPDAMETVVRADAEGYSK